MPRAVSYILFSSALIVSCGGETEVTVRESARKTKPTPKTTTKEDSPQSATLSWKGFDVTGADLEEVEYYFEGRSVGKGQKGFIVFLDRLSKYPKGTMLVIESELNITAYLNAGSRNAPKGEFPFQLIPGMEDKLKKIVKEKKFKWSYNAINIHKGARRKVTMTCKNYVPGEPQRIDFYLDEKYMGKGERGFYRTVEGLSKLEKGTTIVVKSRPTIKGTGVSPLSADSPCSQLGGLEKQLDRVITENGFKREIDFIKDAETVMY